MHRLTPATAFAAATLTAASASAQKVGDAPPDKPWLTATVAIFLLICVAIASMVSSKRGHRD